MSEEQRKYLKLVSLLSFKRIGVKNAAIGRMKKQNALRQWLMNSAQSNSRKREKMKTEAIAMARKNEIIGYLKNEKNFFAII